MFLSLSKTGLNSSPREIGPSNTGNGVRGSGVPSAGGKDLKDSLDRRGEEYYFEERCQFVLTRFGSCRRRQERKELRRGSTGVRKGDDTCLLSMSTDHRDRDTCLVYESPSGLRFQVRVSV